ncbi:hypothetical protein [Planktotalea sp.]|uniref:hypothetical protein n=1 Tax=Planktotalea sp. TaxID=2029877 RepID=UPI0032977619
MTNQGKDPKCRFWCWAIAALLGAFIFIMLMSVAAKSFGASLFLGLVGFVLLGLLFNWLFCAPVPTVDQNRRSASAGATAAVATGAAAAGVAAATSSKASEAPAAAKAEAADASASADTAASAETASAAEAAGASASVSAAPAADIKPSAPLAGEAELAERKGEYKYEAPAAEDTSGADAAAEAEAAAKAAADEEAAAKRKAKRQAKRKAEKEAAAAAALEEEAAAKAKAERQAKRKAQRKAEKEAAAAAAAAEATPDYDGDGIIEGADEGTKPELLTAAREGGADDLKRIKGIGPKLEGVCNDMGVYHFDQIAAWTEQEMAWVNANLQGFKGRATRDKWVEQAKLLAAGEETEFSKRVDKGSVY